MIKTAINTIKGKDLAIFIKGVILTERSWSLSIQEDSPNSLSTTIDGKTYKDLYIENSQEYLYGHFKITNNHDNIFTIEMEEKGKRWWDLLGKGELKNPSLPLLVLTSKDTSAKAYQYEYDKLGYSPDEPILDTQTIKLYPLELDKIEHFIIGPEDMLDKEE